MESEETGADTSAGRVGQPLRNEKINAAVDYDEDRVRLEFRGSCDSFTFCCCLFVGFHS